MIQTDSTVYLYKPLLMAYNLQFFAQDGPGGEKTEEPTSKKLDDARKEGQVAKSKELGNALGLTAFFLVLRYGVGSIGKQLLEMFSIIYGKIPDIAKLVDGEIPAIAINSMIINVILQIIIILAPVLIIGTAVALIGDLVQVGWHPTSKPLQPKFSNMNPVKGVKRIFSKDKIVELIVSFAKIGIIIYVVYSVLKDKMGVLLLLYDIPFQQAIITMGDIAIDMGLKISYIYLALGLLDFGYHKWKFRTDMKMTKQEIKDEYKNSEGDPHVKGKIKQKMREVSMRRMMQDLPKADVVITNPTHFAVAIKYDQEVADAPIVIAKGQDYLAQKIKETAKENSIEIVENKPLARMLYHNVDIGGVIPPELYQAVAEVLAFVYNLKKTG